MVKEVTRKNLIEAKIARSELSKVEGVVVGKKNNGEYGQYLTNYGNLLLNRQIDIFDDAILLLENDRFQSACVISRGIIETHAFMVRRLNRLFI